MMSPVSPDSDLLGLARDICGKLDIRWVPAKIVWTDTYQTGNSRGMPIFSSVPSDHPVLTQDMLLLAPSMKGKLELVEWRPIIASSLIYYGKLASRKTLGIIARTVAFLLVPVVGTGILWLFVNSQSQGSYILFLVVSVPVVLVVASIVIVRYLKRMWLTADRLAAEYVGPLVMLDVLKKIQGFHITETEGGRTSDKPSVTERIAYLNRTTSSI